MSDEKIAYLQLLQEPICRMSTISAIFKGFAATVLAGVSAVPYATVKIPVLFLSFFPVLVFLALDIYYLSLERKFRFLYNQVRKGKHPIDFSMDLPKSSNDLVKAKARVRDCLKSPSIWLFYPLILLILILVFVLKCKGIA